MSSKVTEAELRDHDKLLQTYRDNRTRCGHCELPVMDWDSAYPLSCLHVLCSEQCLIANKIEDVYDCPTCHLSVDGDGLAAWRSIGLALYLKEALLTCTHCLRKVPAIYWCAQCADSLCQPCREGHPMLVRTAKHTVTLFDPNAILDHKNDRVICEKHTERSVKYCMTCNEALCSSPSCCRPHSNHQLKSLRDFIKEFRTKIQKSRESMRGFLAQADPLMNSINDETIKTLDPQTSSEILNLFGTEFNRIMDLVGQSEVLLKERLMEIAVKKVQKLSLKNFTVKSLRTQVSQFLHAIGDTTGISNENIARNYKILNEHFEEIEEGIGVCFDLNDNEDPVVEDYLPAFQQVTDKLEMLIKVLSSDERPSKTIQITKELNRPSTSGTETIQLVAITENGDEMKPEPVAGFSGDVATTPTLKVTVTPKTSKNKKHAEVEVVDVEMEDIKVKVKEDTSSESEEDNGRDGSRGQKEKKTTRATRAAIAAAAASQSPPLKRSSRNKSTTKQSDTFSYETDRPHTRKRKDESPTERRPTSAARTLSNSLSPDTEVKMEPCSRRNSKSPVCVQKIGPSSPDTKKVKDERSESGRDEGGESTSRSPSPNKRKNRRRWSQGNDKPLKSHKKLKPSTPTPTVTATNTPTATPGTSTSGDNMDDIEKEMCEMHGTPELIPTPIPTPSPALKRGPGRPPSKLKQGKKDDGPPKLEAVPSPANPGPGPSTPRKVISAPARIQSPNIMSDKMKITTDSDDPNEDYCAVCLDGGDDVLVCCDDCPKVFHPNCHLPAMTGVPENDWQCMFCKPLEALPAHTFTLTPEEVKKLAATNLEVPSHLPRGRFLYACKFLCELYKGKDYTRLMVHYYTHLRGQLTDSPINLNYFRRRLTYGKPEPFQNTEDMIPLLRKMIARAKKVYKTSPIELHHVAAIDRKFNANILIYFPNLVSPLIPRRIANADDGEESDSDSEKEEEPSTNTSTESESMDVVEIINQDEEAQIDEAAEAIWREGD